MDTRVVFFTTKSIPDFKQGCFFNCSYFMTQIGVGGFVISIAHGRRERRRLVLFIRKYVKAAPVWPSERSVSSGGASFRWCRVCIDFQELAYIGNQGVQVHAFHHVYSLMEEKLHQVDFVFYFMGHRLGCQSCKWHQFNASDALLK